MTTNLPLLSYFNPLSTLHHSLADFAKVKKSHKAVIIVCTALTALISIPIIGLGAVALFRKLTEHFSKSDEKTQKVANNIIVTSKPASPTPNPKVKEEEKKQEPKIPTPPRRSPRLQAKQKSPLKAPPKPVTPKKKKGYIVMTLGSDRVKYWCPKVGAVAGLVLGFYSANLATNFALFLNSSAAAKAEVLTQGAAKLSPFIDKCTSCNAAILPATAAGVDANLISQIDTMLTEVVKTNAESFQVIKDVSLNLAKEAASSKEAGLLSMEGAKSAISFVQAASHGDVPIKIISLTNGLGALTGAYSGYKAGEMIAIWLDS